MNARKWIAHFFLLLCAAACGAGMYVIHSDHLHWPGSFEQGFSVWLNRTGGPIVVMTTQFWAAWVAANRYRKSICSLAWARQGLRFGTSRRERMAGSVTSWASMALLILALLVGALSVALVADGWRRVGFTEETIARDICAFALAFVGCAYWTIVLPFARVPRAKVIAPTQEVEEDDDDGADET